MYGRQRVNVTVEREALFLIHLRAYAHLKNYATVEIHLSIGSTVFSLKIFFGKFEYFALLADLNPPWPYYFTSKQLLDKVFVISGIIKVEVSLISRAVGRS